MDTSEYMPMFIAEAREHLQELNLALIALEERPDDRATVDELFRGAHSLKGMSATMGFAQIAALTHQMEDVFELLRQRAGGLQREAVDTVLACVDALSAAIDSIEVEGVERLDSGELVAALQRLVRADVARTRAATPDALPHSFDADGRRVLRVSVSLTQQASMPAVRAFMLLAALDAHGQVLASVPRRDAVEGFSASLVQALLASDDEQADVAAALREVGDVAAVEIVEVVERLELVDEDDRAKVVHGVGATGVDDDGASAGAVAGAVENARAEAAGAYADEPPVGRIAHPDEPPVGRVASSGSTAKTVRVDADRLDQLMHFTGELVIQRTAVELLAAQLHSRELTQSVQALVRTSQALQAMVMQVRMVPIDAVLQRFPRVVRDLSGQLGKEVQLRLVGRETELDRTLVDAIGDPLAHLVRNSLDHGLEGPSERQQAGKPSCGSLEISACHAGGNVVISVRDDGRGIDPQRVARKALQRGLIAAEEVAGVDLARAIELLFCPGFSTAETTSDLSGRGVGMDAVQTTVRELGGHVTVDSRPGRWTLTQIRLPLTLAIVSALLIEAGGEPFAIPLDRVETTLALDAERIRCVGGKRMLVLRDCVLPLLDAGSTLGRAPHDPDTTRAVVVRCGEHRLALAVSKLVGQRELVTRALPAVIAEGEAVSAGAVLPDGRIALIVDCDALQQRTAVAA